MMCVHSLKIKLYISFSHLFFEMNSELKETISKAKTCIVKASAPDTENKKVGTCVIL